MASSRVSKTAKECHEIFQSLQPGEVVRVSGAPKCGKSTLARELLLSRTWKMWAQKGEAFLIVSGRSVADEVNERIFHCIEYSTSSRIVKTLPALAYSLLQKPVRLLDAMEQEKLLVEVIKKHIHHAQVGDDCSTCDLLRLYIGQNHIQTDGDTSAIQFQKLLSPLFIDQLRAGISWLNELGIATITEKNPSPLEEVQRFPHVTLRQKVEWDTLLILRKEYGECIAQTYSKDSHLDTSLLLRKAASSINQMKLDKKISIPQAVCIDDCQDLTIAGYDLIRALALAGSRIVLIGNDDESVQGFRGAYPEVLTYLELQSIDNRGLGARHIELLPDEEEIATKLAINRNTVIRKVAQDVSIAISPSFGLSDESLLSRAGKIRDLYESKEESSKENFSKEDKSCYATIFSSPQDEIEGIINQIKRWRIGENSCQWNEIAVISHDNSYLRLLGRKCENEGIPYTYSSTTSPLRESSVIRGMLAMMKLASTINKIHTSYKNNICDITNLEENNSSSDGNSSENFSSNSRFTESSSLSSTSSSSLLSSYQVWQLWATALKSPLFTTPISASISQSAVLPFTSQRKNQETSKEKNSISDKNFSTFDKRNARWDKIQSVFETIVALMTLSMRANECCGEDVVKEDMGEENKKREGVGVGEDKDISTAENISTAEKEDIAQVSHSGKVDKNTGENTKESTKNVSDIERLCHYWKSHNNIYHVCEELPSIESVSTLLLENPASGAGELLLRIADSIAGGCSRRNHSHLRMISEKGGAESSQTDVNSEDNDNSSSADSSDTGDTDKLHANLRLDALYATQADIRLLEKAWRAVHDAVESTRKAMKKWQSSSSVSLNECDLDASITLWEIWDAVGLADQWSQEALANGREGQESNRRLDDIIRLQQRATTRFQEEGVESFVDRIEQAQLEADSLAYTAPRPDNIILATPAGSANLDVKNVWIAGVQQKVWPNMGAKSTLFSTDILTSIILFLMIYGFPSDPESLTQLAVISPTSLRSEVQRTMQMELKSFLVALTRASQVTIISAVKSEDTDPSEFIDVFIPDNRRYIDGRPIDGQHKEKQDGERQRDEQQNSNQKNNDDQHMGYYFDKQEEILVDIPSLVTYCRTQLIDAVAHIVTLAEEKYEEETIASKKKFIEELLEDITNSVQTLFYLAQHNINHVDSARWMFQSNITFHKDELKNIIESLNELLASISQMLAHKDLISEQPSNSEAHSIGEAHNANHQDIIDVITTFSTVCDVLNTVCGKMENKVVVTKTSHSLETLKNAETRDSIDASKLKEEKNDHTSESLSLSPSSVDKIWACPLQWALDNRFSGPRASTFAASFGTVIHLCAQWATENGFDKDKKYSNIEELTQKLLEHYDEILQEHNNQDVLSNYTEATNRRVVYKTLRTIAQYFIDSRDPNYSAYSEKSSELAGVGTLQDSFSEVSVQAEFTLNDILEKLIRPTFDLSDTTWEEVRVALNILCGGFVDENFSAQEKISLHATIDRLELRGSQQTPLVNVIDYKTGSRDLKSFTDLQLICYQLALIFDKNAARYQEKRYANVLKENSGNMTIGGAENKKGDNAACDYTIGLASRGFLERSMLFKVKTDIDPAPYYKYAENGYQPQLQSPQQGISRKYYPRYRAKNVSTFFSYKKELPETVLEEINAVIEAKNPHMKGFFARLHYLIQEVLDNKISKENVDSAEDILLPECDLLIWALTMLARVFYAASCIRAQNLPAKKGAACGYCQFRPICPAWKEDSRTIYGDVM